MTIRSRTSTSIGGVGTYHKDFPAFGEFNSGTVTIPGNSATCTDVVDGTFMDHPLDIHKKSWSGHTFTAPLYVQGGTITEYKDFCPGYFQAASLGHLALPSLNDALDSTKAFARTNPSRTVVDIPSFIGELKELPHLLELAGRTLIKKGASAYLSYEYGWKPLISDLVAFVDFQSQISKRTLELSNLHKKGGLRRRFQLSRDTATSKEANLWVESSLFTLACNHTIVTSRSRWATSRWLPTSPEVISTDAELRKQAARAVYGLSLNVRSAWELIPWSWLIDWTSSVGDYLEANRNTVGASCSGVNLMTHTESVHTFDGYQLLSGNGSYVSPNWRIGPTRCIVTDKLRSFSSSPSITADLPFLSGRQMSILGALGIQRIRRKHGIAL